MVLLFRVLKGTGDGSVGGFWWSLHFNWMSIPARIRNAQKSRIDPYPCVAFAFEIFARNEKLKFCWFYLDHRRWRAVF